MKINTDTKERIKIGALFIFQSYKIIMGSLLTLFVPQMCELPNQEDKICSINDNISKKELINNISLGFNCLSVLLFLTCYCVELKRENFLIKHLDINHNYSDNNLDKIISEKPSFKIILKKYNLFYFKLMIIINCLYLINLILSSIAIYEHYAGISTLTSYISYTALISLKLYNSTYISYISNKKDRALSAYITEFSSFNTFDPDYLKQCEVEKKNLIITNYNKNNKVENNEVENNEVENNENQNLEIISDKELNQKLDKIITNIEKNTNDKSLDNQIIKEKKTPVSADLNDVNIELQTL